MIFGGGGVGPVTGGGLDMRRVQPLCSVPSLAFSAGSTFRSQWNFVVIVISANRHCDLARGGLHVVASLSLLAVLILWPTASRLTGQSANPSRLAAVHAEAPESQASAG